MKQDIGELLVENGQITAEELDRAVQEANMSAQPVGRVLMRLGLVNEENLKTILELHYGVSYLDLKKAVPDPNIVDLVPEEIAWDCCAVPVQMIANRLTLAMVMPTDEEALAKVSQYLKNWQLKVVVCSDDGFVEFMSRAYPFIEEQPAQSTLTSDSQADFIDLSNLSEPDTSVLDSSVDEGRAIMLLSQHILANAITKGCTNIHIEPGERQVLVHYRKEGILFSARKLPKAILPDLVQRFKTMAARDAAGTDLPVDGLLTVRHGGKIFQCRLSIVPGTHGQHLVIWLE